MVVHSSSSSRRLTCISASAMEGPSSIEVLRRQELSSHYQNRDYLHRRTADRESPTSTAAAVVAVSPLIRREMVHWIFSVASFLKLNNPDELAILSVTLLDRFMQTKQAPGCLSTVSNFRLAAIACFYLTTKLHHPSNKNDSNIGNNDDDDTMVVTSELMAILSHGVFGAEQVKEMELFILQALEWHVYPPTALAFCREFLELIPCSVQQVIKDAAYDLCKTQIRHACLDYALFPRLEASTLAYLALGNALKRLGMDAMLVKHVADICSFATRTDFGGRKHNNNQTNHNNSGIKKRNKMDNDGISRDDEFTETLYKVIAPFTNGTNKKTTKARPKRPLFSSNQENKNSSNNIHLRHYDGAPVEGSPCSVVTDHTQALTDLADIIVNHCSSSRHHYRRRQRKGMISSIKSSHVKSMLAFLFIASCLLESTQARQLEQHGHLFPANDEYDPIVLDATNIYGSPFGGYSRATKSRLASRSLKLPDQLVREDDDEGSVAATERYFWEIADGLGRSYACRIFDEDEVEPTSLSDSLFDPPSFRLAVELDNKRHNDLGERLVRVVGNTNLYLQQSFEESLASPKPPTDAWSKLKRPEDVAESEKIEFVEGEAEGEFEELEIDRRLDLLEGACIQKQLQYWTFEWCWKKKFQKFHVNVLSKDPHQRRIQLEQVTNLGYYSVRDIRVRLALEGVDEIGQVTETYRHGEKCTDEGKPFKTNLRMRCCSENMTEYQDHSTTLLFGVPVDFTLASITSVWEDPNESCKYHVDICSPILCYSTDSDDIDKLFHDYDRYERNKPTSTDSHTTTSKAGAKQSIMEIIDESLVGDHCLYSKKDGWWLYEYCHKRYIRQFSGQEKFSGIDLEDDSQYLLGYFINESDASAARKDWERVVNVTDSTGQGTAQGAMNRGGNGAYYEVEFGAGEICVLEDAKDEHVGEKIERACTARFSCGEEFLLTVREDSTCHYVAEIGIPALCQHPLFKPLVKKRRSFKCLPVGEE